MAPCPPQHLAFEVSLILVILMFHFMLCPLFFYSAFVQDLWGFLPPLTWPLLRTQQPAPPGWEGASCRVGEFWPRGLGAETQPEVGPVLLGVETRMHRVTPGPVAGTSTGSC